MTTYNQPPRWDESHRQQSGPTRPFGAGQRIQTNQGVVPASDERTLAMLAHLSAPIAWAVSVGWLNFLGPFIVWALFKDRSPFVRNAAAGSFNFTLSMTILSVVGWLMIFTILLAPLGILLVGLSGTLAIVLGILGAVRTWNGRSYTYPWQFRALS